MSETPEQFRERMGRVAAETIGDPWETAEPHEQKFYADAAEAVAAQTLRNVLAMSVTGSDCEYVPVYWIVQWAAQRGIDLTDSEGAR